MSRTRIYARSLIASWIGYGANLVVMLLLSRLVVHGLGKSTYGVWSLLMTVTGYLGLAEIGVRVSTGRYINYYIGRGRPDRVGEVVSTSLVFYTLLGAALVMGAWALGAAFGTIFPKVPAELAAQAPWVLMLAAGNIWMGFLSSVFGQLLQARNRFDLRSAVMLVTLAVRAGGTVLVLRAGGGLVALAAVLTISSTVSFVLLAAAARWKGAPAKLAWRNVSRRRFGEVFRYGSWAFVHNLGLRIIAYTDLVLIALLLGMEEIALYSIALMLADHGGHFVAHVYRVIVPDVLKTGGRNDLATLRRYIVGSARVALLVAIPLFAGLMVLGGDFIRLWIGPGFEASRWVLVILVVVQLSGMLRWGPALGLKATGHVKTTALIALAEAGLNLLCSGTFVLVFGWGIYGVAAGTAVPTVLFGCTAMLVQASRRIGLDMKTYLRELVVPTVAAAAVFTLLCVAVRQMVEIHSWRTFLLAVAILAGMYLPVGFYVFLSERDRLALLQRVPMLRGRFDAKAQLTRPSDTR